MRLFYANWTSDQIANAAANPLVKNDPTTDNDVNRRYFSFSSSSVAQNDTVQLILIKKGERVMFGRIGNSAWGTSVTLTLGDGTTANKFLGSTAIATAGTTDFANTVALAGLGSGGVATADFYLTATIGGAAPAAGANSFNGYIDVMNT